MQIKEAIKKYSPVIEKEGISLLELEILLAFALGEDKEYLIAHDDQEMGEDELKMFESYLERAIQGEPIAYITNEKEFFGLNFYVDQRVLVPRPETEIIVEMAAKYLVDKDEQATVLDLGTGSGNILIALIKHLSLMTPELNVKGEGTDISEEAIEVARMNAEQHTIEDRIHLFKSDLLENIDSNSKYEVILANLPYVGEEKNHFLEKNVEENEPHVALFGGKDGLDLYRKLFQQIKDKDIDFDLMLGEFGFAQGEAMSAILEEYFQSKWSIIKDGAGIERIYQVCS